MTTCCHPVGTVTTTSAMDAGRVAVGAGVGVGGAVGVGGRVAPPPQAARTSAATMSGRRIVSPLGAPRSLRRVAPSEVYAPINGLNALGARSQDFLRFEAEGVT